MDNDNRNGQGGVKNPGEFDAGFDPTFERRNSKAAEDLQAAETNAANAEMNNAEDSIAGARGTEEKAGGFYSGAGRPKLKQDKKKGGLRGWLKKRGPMLLIGGLVGGAGGLMMGVQTLMPVAIEEMIIEKFNSIGVSSTIASDSWLDTQLNYGLQGSAADGTDAKMYGLSDYQVQQFENQGMKVVEVGSYVAILYKSGQQWIPVVGSSHLGTASASAIAEASGLSNVGAPVSATTALADMNFKTPYTTAAKSWRGGSSGWFDSIMSDVTETKLSIGRNRWARYAANSLADLSEDFKKTAASAVKAKTSDGGVAADETVPITEKNPDGTTTTRESEPRNITEVAVDGGSSQNVSDTSIKQDTSETELTNVMNSKAMKAAGAVADGLDWTCAAVEGLMSIYTVVSAYQSLQFLNLVSGYLEAVDKVKAGEGDSSPIHEYNTNLTTTAATVKVSSDGSTSKDNVKMGGTVEETVANKTAMESAGMAWLFSNDTINSNDTSVQNVNIESIMSDISSVTANVRVTAQVFEACGYIRVATSTLGLVTTIISFIPIFGQGVKAIQLGVKKLAEVAVKLAVQIFFYAMIPVVTKQIANSIIKDAATEWFGEDLGNAMISGASKYLGGNGTSGGQSPGSEDKVLAYLGEREVVIAEEARYQRATRSPFDASSPYTFLGTLAYSVLPMAYSNSGVMSAIKNASSLTSNAVVAMSPAASAVGLNDELTSTGECALLNSVDAVGDAFCNPYVITDTSTAKISPVAISSLVHEMHSDTEIAAAGHHYIPNESQNFDANGNVQKGSNLAKYITYCGQRTSQYGVKDATIAEAVSSGNGATDIMRSAVSLVPGVGDAAGVISALKDVNNYVWATGQACVASSVENTKWDSEYKYYQRYAENERLLENMNPNYTSPVSKYLAQYYVENPVDESFEGTIARFAGMTTEEVEDTMTLIAYYLYLDEYDPSALYAFGAKYVPEGAEDLTAWRQDKGETVAAYIYNIWWYGVEYADVRNRVATVV